MGMSEAEARIRRLVARIGDGKTRVVNLGDRVDRLQQNVAGVYQVGADFNQCLTTIQGRVSGFDSTFLPLANSTVQITGTTTLIDYGTYFTATGDFEVPISLHPNDNQFKLVVCGPAPHFAPSTPYPFNVGANRCKSAFYGTVGGTLQSGYDSANYKAMTNPVQSGGWVEFDSQYPLSLTLNYDHTRFGTGTMICPSSGGIHRGPCFEYAFSAFGSCPAVTSPVTINLYHDGHPVLGAYHAGLMICPLAATCATVPEPALSFMTSVVVSKQYTSPTTKYDFTFKVPANTNAWGGTVDQFVRMWES